MTLNIYALNIGAPNLIKQIWLGVKPPSNISKIVVGAFNTLEIPINWQAFPVKKNKQKHEH